MYKITSEDKDLQKMVNKDRASLATTFSKNFEIQEKTLDLISKSIRHADFNRFDSNKIIWNVAGYVNILSYDLKVVVKNLVLAKEEWEKRYFVRQLALLAYEGMNDLLELLGKTFRRTRSTLSNHEKFIDELNTNVSRLNTFKSTREHSLKKIRNVSIAHRDRSSIEQLNVIYDITWSEGISIGTEFDQILNPIGGFLQNVINKSVVEFEELKTRNK
ncbi:hypothetical protein [Dyadobacter sp. Leaf189]|uniref:hypothetical protein n=1 Tax=Dyadobacter sp. Leaf189 TaxID=1736295 RepID=UPI00070110FE|nr:hypothetical protein [Dyadobacter sp. Leaf189]KQS33403.1 hypothetical protein ASG33_04815 [Dyadobacter sp. Leaf189]